MASTTVRRPLPALISLLALLLLTGIVWWRVVNRDDTSEASPRCPTPTPTATASTGATLPAPADVVLQVVNSTSRQGLAGTARTDLMQRGFRIPGKAANDPVTTANPGVAQIRFGPASRQAATLVRYYLPGATLVPSSSTSTTVVVALGAKYRSVATQAAVTAALKGDRVTLRSPSPAPTSTAGSTAGSTAASAPATASPSC